MWEVIEIYVHTHTHSLMVIGVTGKIRKIIMSQSKELCGSERTLVRECLVQEFPTILWNVLEEEFPEK